MSEYHEIYNFDDACEALGADRAALLLAGAAREWSSTSAETIAANRELYLDIEPNLDWDGMMAVKRACAEALADTSRKWVEASSDLGTADERLRSDLAWHLQEKFDTDLKGWVDDETDSICKTIRHRFADAVKHDIEERGDECDVSMLSDGSPSRSAFGPASTPIRPIAAIEFEATLMLYENDPEIEGRLIDAIVDWRDDNVELIERNGEDVYAHLDGFAPFRRPSDVPHTIFDMLCESQGTTVEKVVNRPETQFEESFKEDLMNCQEGGMPGLAVMCRLGARDFIAAAAAMDMNLERHGSAEVARAMRALPGDNEPLIGVYDPYSGWGGTMETALDKPFEIPMDKVKWAMQEPDHGRWESDRVDLYTPQDCYEFCNPFRGRLESSDAPLPTAPVAAELPDFSREETREGRGDEDVCL